MIGRVGLALAAHEALERARDRWVVIISGLFALLASAVTLYGRDAGGNATTLTGPSLVTLASLLTPLVALVLSHDSIVGERDRNTLGLLLSLPVSRMEVVVAKFLGRALALIVATSIGLGIAAAIAGGSQAGVIVALLAPTLWLGLAFLSMGMLISSLVARPVTAASAVIAVWFLMVFFYDLGLLGALVLSDGEIAADTISSLVVANPAGLYRIEAMERMAGPDVLANMGLAIELPGGVARAVIWLAWIILPVVFSGALLSWRRAVR